MTGNTKLYLIKPGTAMGAKTKASIEAWEALWPVGPTTWLQSDRSEV